MFVLIFIMFLGTLLALTSFRSSRASILLHWNDSMTDTPFISLMKQPFSAASSSSSAKTPCLPLLPLVAVVLLSSLKGFGSALHTESKLATHYDGDNDWLYHFLHLVYVQLAVSLLLLMTFAPLLQIPPHPAWSLLIIGRWMFQKSEDKFVKHNSPDGGNSSHQKFPSFKGSSASPATSTNSLPMTSGLSAQTWLNKSTSTIMPHQ